MSYFKYHPIFEYYLNGTSHEMIDIFRKNFITVSANFKDEFLLTNNETPERVAAAIYEDESKSWVINVVNNIQMANDWKFTVDLKLTELSEKHKNTKVYSIRGLPALFSDDVLVEGKNLHDGFSPTMDNFVIIRKWDSYFRSIEVVEPASVSFVEGVTLSALRPNETTKSFDIIVEGITLERKTDYIEYPIKFSNPNGDYISPYINPSNGVIYSSGVTGASFEDTLLFDYLHKDTITYFITTPMSQISSSTDTKIEVPSLSSIPIIEEQMKETLSKIDQFRNYNITIG